MSGIVGRDGVTVLREPARRPHQRELQQAGITHPTLKRDYVMARALLQHHGTSYARATALMEPGKRPHVWALYGFARKADEFVDNRAEPDPRGLQEWSEQVLGAARPLLDGEVPAKAADVVAASSDHIVRAMLNTCAMLRLPSHLMESFLDSMVSDITTTRYADYDALRKYMYGSAEVIGLQMLPLLDPVDAGAAHRACLLGEAFQISNFLRDVADDFRRGRVYLPQDLLAQHGASDSDIARSVEVGEPTDALRSAIVDLARFNLSTYEQARPGLKMLGATSEPAIAAAFALYRGITVEVLRARGNVFNDRLRVPRRRRIRLVAPHLARGVAARVRRG